MNRLPIEELKAVPELEHLFPVPENVQEILEDIRLRGIQEPLVITPGKELVCGYTRLRLALELGLPAVPVREETFEDQLAMQEYAIRDNLHRRQLTKLQMVELCGKRLEAIEAERARRRMAAGKAPLAGSDPVDTVATGSPGKTRDKVGQALGMSGRSYDRWNTVAERAHPETKRVLEEGHITLDMALDLCRLDPPEQAKLLSRTDPEALGVGRLTNKVFDYEERKRKREHRRLAEVFFQEHPDAGPLLEAYRQGWVDIRGGRVVVENLYHKLHPDRPLPRYSGQKWVTVDEFTAPETLFRIPLFTVEEWAEIEEEGPLLKPEAVLDDLFPGLPFDVPVRPWSHVRETPSDRRTYDPRHGRALFRGRNGQGCCGDECFEGEWEQIAAWPETAAGLIFVKRGWGSWKVVEFNDGEGHRTRRRYFFHDHILWTLIQEAMDTVTPGRFSHSDYGRLSIPRAQKSEWSWWYARRATIPADEAIQALEADLADLKRKTKARKNPERLLEDLLDYLQGYVFEYLGQGWREGVQGDPRRDDGTVDEDFWDGLHPGYKNAALKWRTKGAGEWERAKNSGIPGLKVGKTG